MPSAWIPGIGNITVDSYSTKLPAGGHFNSSPSSGAGSFNSPQAPASSNTSYSSGSSSSRGSTSTTIVQAPVTTSANTPVVVTDTPIPVFSLPALNQQLGIQSNQDWFAIGIFGFLILFVMSLFRG